MEAGDLFFAVIGDANRLDRAWAYGENRAERVIGVIEVVAFMERSAALNDVV
mgnify:CR=1 FL=1